MVGTRAFARRVQAAQAEASHTATVAGLATCLSDSVILGHAFFVLKNKLEPTKKMVIRNDGNDQSFPRVGDALFFHQPQTLIRDGRARVRSTTGTKPTYNGHFFYVYRVDGVAMLLVPCSSIPTGDSVRLDPVSKLGHPRWTCQVTFVLVSQVWAVERAVLSLAASGPVHSTYGRNCVRYGWRSGIDEALSRADFSGYPFNAELN